MSVSQAVVSIIAAALGSLYLQLLSTGTVLYLYHVIFTPVTIQYPIASLGMVFLAWGSGVGIGMLFLAAKPWAPGVVGIISVVYQRANMIASGKMFVANAMPTYILNLFDWNPLFHTIDQSRGFLFLNYTPLYSNWVYAFWVGLALVVMA